MSVITFTNHPEKKTKEKTLKDGSKKEIKKSEFVFVNFKTQTSITMSYKDVIEMIEDDEIELYK